MFSWDKSLTQIDVVVSQVVHLFRSMRDVQIALPGAPVQQATAFLCQYEQGGGVETVAAFHLLKTNQLAFYCSDPRRVGADKAENMLDQGLNFVESMGFLLSDMDIHLLDEGDREMLWDSLPLRSGTSQVVDEETAPVTAPPPAKPVAEQPVAAVAKSAEKKPDLVAEPKQEAAVKAVKPAEPADQSMDDGVDDLLAAVESMRAKRPGLRVRKKIPSAEEIDKRRVELRENLGRILSSL